MLKVFSERVSRKHRKIQLFVLGVLLLLSTKVLSDDRKELEVLAMTFALGFWNQDEAAVLSTLHPALSKKGIVRNWKKSNRQVMDTLPPDRLDVLATHYNKDGRLDDLPAPKVFIRYIDQDIAAIELVNDAWFDFFQAVKIDNKWRLLNCVYGRGKDYKKTKSLSDLNAITSVVERYMSGMLGDQEDMVRSTHINLARRKIENKNTPNVYIGFLPREQLLLNVGTFDLNKSKIKYSVTNHTNELAAVKIDFGLWREHVQLLKINEQWSIVNSFVD